MSEKNLRLVATQAVAADLSEQIPKLLFYLISLFQEYTLDMYVIERSGIQTQIRAAGYKNFIGDLDETTILKKIECQYPETIWFKVDDYGKYYVGTLLYPSEY